MRVRIRKLGSIVVMHVVWGSGFVEESVMKNSVLVTPKSCVSGPPENSDIYW